MMKIGYGRTSTFEQVAGLEAQIEELEAAGCEKVFTEQLSSVAKRKQLDAAIEYAREGDVLVVTKLDRLARSVSDLVKITERLSDKGVELNVLAMGLDTTTSTGRLMLNLVGSIAQFEREVMLERQREGIAKAKSEGRYKGRAPTARRQIDKILDLKSRGLRAEEIGSELGISRSSVFRLLAESRSAETVQKDAK